MEKTNFPEVYILGSPKCGTTTIAAWLSEHPEIAFSAVKEPHYFNTDMPSHRSRNEVEYLGLFENAQTGQTRVEASVWYLYSQAAVPEILKVRPDAKFVVCVRNPVDMAPSLHSQLLYNGSEDIESFEEAWAAQEDRRNGKRIPKLSDDPSLLFYEDVCSGGALLDRLFKRVAADRVHVVLMDDLRDDPEIVWWGLCDFIGITQQEREGYAGTNIAATRKWPMLARVIRRLTTARKKLGVNLPSGALREKVRRVLDRIDRANRTVGEKRRLSSETRARLWSAFRNDVARLEELLGRDLAHWNPAQAEKGGE